MQPVLPFSKQYCTSTSPNMCRLLTDVLPLHKNHGPERECRQCARCAGHARASRGARRRSRPRAARRAAGARAGARRRAPHVPHAWPAPSCRPACAPPRTPARPARAAWHRPWRWRSGRAAISQDKARMLSVTWCNGVTGWACCPARDPLVTPTVRCVHTLPEGPRRVACRVRAPRRPLPAH